MIQDNLSMVRYRIMRACAKAGRDPQTVTIVAVTKKVPVPVIQEAIGLGLTNIGENQVQEARNKKAAGAYRGAKLILIGHLQTNKASLAVRTFDEIHSVDSLKVAEAISRYCIMYRKGLEHMPVLLEVNSGRDPRKHGVLPEEAPGIVRKILELPGIVLRGLFTVAPGQGDPELAREAFRELRVLRDKLLESGVPQENMIELSMGMSSDFEIAIEEGATMIRLGTAIFGPR